MKLRARIQTQVHPSTNQRHSLLLAHAQTADGRKNAIKNPETPAQNLLLGVSIAKFPRPKSGNNPALSITQNVGQTRYKIKIKRPDRRRWARPSPGRASAISVWPRRGWLASRGGRGAASLAPGPRRCGPRLGGTRRRCLDAKCAARSFATSSTRS